MANDVLNTQMKEVADFFVGKFQADSDVLFAKELSRENLDYSLDSLKEVDRWLSILAKDEVDPNKQNSAETIIWTGAYVGEVIRKCSQQEYNWQRYDDAMKGQSDDIKNIIPSTFGTQFMLTTTHKGFTLPINKVIRFLAEGPENSLHFYAGGYCDAKEKMK